MFRYVFASTAAVAALAAPAFAGGPTPVFEEPAVIAPVVTAPVYDWTGFYVGGQLGWGWATGGARSAAYNALKNCIAADAKVIAQKLDCWMALALGDDKTACGWGYAGNRADAEKHALEDCKKRTTNVKIVVSFCTNGVEQ